jgi:chromosome partitioning protein
MYTIAIANHKGGVGKSVTAQALGVILSQEHGRRVLLVDLDPQGSLTAACGASGAERSMADVLGGAAPGTLALGDVLAELGPGLALATADIALATSELGLVSRMGRENTLKRALGTVAGRFDVCLLDCPPSLGLLTVNALTAADAVLIPTQPQITDLRGLSLFLDSLGRVREALNPELATLGIVATFYDARLVHHRDALETMRRAGLPLLGVTVGRSVRVAEAAIQGESVVTYDKAGKRTAEYRQLGEVIAQWLQEHA